MTDVPVFNQFNLVVTDMDAAVTFYRRLGLTIPETEPEWASHHREAAMPGDVDLDFDSVQSAETWNRGWAGSTRMGVLGFRVPFARSRRPDRRGPDRRRLQGTAAAERRVLGARYAVMEDPDGNAVGIMSPQDPARRSAPPTLDPERREARRKTVTSTGC